MTTPPSASTHARSPARPHQFGRCLAPGRPTEHELNKSTDAPVTATPYGRLFPELPALDFDESLVQALGQSGGACDATSMEGGDAMGAAGWPFFGQFVAHDITADRSALVHRADVTTLSNARRQKIDLEFLYGAGPAGDPFLYDVHDQAKLLLGRNELGEPDDVQRNVQGLAIIGDPRNDSHLVVSQMHLAFCKFHNAVVDRLRAEDNDAHTLFDDARRVVRWHYQWIVLHEFLPLLVGDDLAASLRDVGTTYYHPGATPFIPLEFADAAYRYGHCQIRNSYRINARMSPVPLFPDLAGFRPVPCDRTVDWSFLFDIPGRAPAQRAKKIDGRLCGSLMRLPESITGEVAADAHRSLAVRDLQRGIAVGLPSGEAVARHIGATPLTAAETGLEASGWDGETPLWYYVLKEAEARNDGDRLGPVGGRIVGEVLVGLIDHDPLSYRTNEPAWCPTLGARRPDWFALADLLAMAV
jgi:hypothetical protein